MEVQDFEKLGIAVFPVRPFRQAANGLTGPSGSTTCSSKRGEPSWSMRAKRGRAWVVRVCWTTSAKDSRSRDSVTSGLSPRAASRRRWGCLSSRQCIGSHSPSWTIPGSAKGCTGQMPARMRTGAVVGRSCA
ncbi:hypothetical protein H340_01464 [Streptomyces mobaraensis NBRC 13819 = DSM 40847]|uniref:Uncharacterized protein n=1 Tax=Streptomyces mobaraensis (strain ATCC 29032 / DSM 40847 / JCM 4168 / NBRC 13819 / NCIMB 11159 / IPCR 16-22) TaxID=1223523 RepID=M3B8Y0_STRM1|nr:hypothetical protein H340_01464 [Streptomyces mobaraensis NBRC 13819 = DSM 40847]